MKKYLSLILSVILIFSSFSMLSVSAEEGTEETETNRYYFYLPEEWENEYSSTAYIFWMHGSYIPASWPGFEGIKTDIEGLYYYDVPNYVQYISWGNGVSFNENFESDIKYGRNCYIETFNNDNKVYAIDHDKTIGHIGVASPSYSGQWYYYYGNGEYGLYKEKGEEFYSCRSFGGDNPAPTLETNRYYFYMPNDWENALSKDAGIYWWEGTNSCNIWPGYKANKADVDGLYYYDVPKDVTTIIWNNFIDSGMDPESEVYKFARMSSNIGCEYYEPGESETYPEGLVDFDNMVYVLDYDTIDYNSFVYPHPIRGEWYYYYGNGQYGTTREKGDVVYTQRYFGTSPTGFGDVNLDGKLNIKDATAIQKHIANLILLTETEESVADFNSDGRITIQDATAIQKHIAKL